MLEHYEIGWALRTGYPSWMQPEDDDFDQDAYDAYCYALYEESRERAIFGE